MTMLRTSSHGLVVTIASLAVLGCTPRGADDRIATQDDRMCYHGPSVAVVAYRETDRARISGNTVIVNPAGLEPVYVTQRGIYQIRPEDVHAEYVETQGLLQHLQALEDRLPLPTAATAHPPGRPVTASPPTAPSAHPIHHMEADDPVAALQAAAPVNHLSASSAGIPVEASAPTPSASSAG